MFPIPGPSVAKYGLGKTVSSEEENVGSVVDHPMPAAPQRASIGHLSPLFAVVLPCIIDKNAILILPPEQHNSITNSIVSQYVSNPIAWPGILFLRPLIAIPAPGIGKKNLIHNAWSILAAEKDDLSALAVECNSSVTSSRRAGIRHLSILCRPIPKCLP
jgi:hypothetical protein